MKEGLLRDLITSRWVVNPGLSFSILTPDPPQTLFIASSFKLLMIPIVLYINWELLAPYVAPDVPNPIAPLIFISHPIPSSSPDDPRYAKGYLDLVFLAFHIVFYSFLRQFVTTIICWPIARYFGIKKQGKLDRFGEQGYALLYFTIMGAWGFVSSSLCSPRFFLNKTQAYHGTTSDMVVSDRVLLDWYSTFLQHDLG